MTGISLPHSRRPRRRSGTTGIHPRSGWGDTSRCHPSHTTGHTGHVPGGSTRLSWVRNMKSRETERVEVVVAQGLLDRRVSGHAPEPRRRTGGDRCIELGYAATAQFVEAVVPVLPLPPRYERNLRRIHASRLVSTRGVWQKPK